GQDRLARPFAAARLAVHRGCYVLGRGTVSGSCCGSGGIDRAHRGCDWALILACGSRPIRALRSLRAVLVEQNILAGRGASGAVSRTSPALGVAAGRLEFFGVPLASQGFAA